MRTLVCSHCGTGEHVAKVQAVSWCHDCWYDAHPEIRPIDRAASRSAWRTRAERGLPAFAEADLPPVAQTIGLLFRMRD
jgi:hypothetical protein